MEFSNTTLKNGLIQHCEELCNLGDGGISGDPTELIKFTAKLNRAYDDVIPYVLRSDGTWQWDDKSQVDFPIATTNIVSGQRGYSFLSDEQGNSILEITSVAIKTDATTSDYTVIDPSDRSNRTEVGKALIENNSTDIGTPTSYDKLGNSIIFNPTPNYASLKGLKISFSRTPIYFLSTDTIKTAGIPDYFQSLLSLIASHEWIIINKSDNSTLITRIEGMIAQKKAGMEEFMRNRNKDNISNVLTSETVNSE